MELTALIEQHQGRLTPADERVVRAMLADPVAASFWSASELAQRAGVHEASVVRLAQKLGFKGYPELRATLQDDVISDAKPAERVRRRLAQAADSDLLAALVGDEIAALQELARTVTQAQLDAAAQLLARARRVALFGSGHATALVELMDRRLRRSGCATLVLPDSARDLAEHLLPLRPDDALLVFAFRTRPPRLDALLSFAATLGAPVVLVSDTLGPLIRPQPQVLLAAPRGAAGDYQTLTVPMAICNALILTLARVDGGRSLESLRLLESLLEQFGYEGGR
jgi:DNA-binding MurR/RpiR family transcriptional regulator